MSAIRYLLDENVDVLYHAQLLRREPMMVVWRVGTPGAPPRGALDPDILLWCEQNSFILVTNNRHSMPAHLREHLAQGRHAPGIFVLGANMSIGETIEELLLIWGASEEEEYHDRISFLPVSS
ncbi:MAG: DUF5615 family PIN-like protein [Chloroflexi bacterium]|nr:DUF5615 family PIN-like protein [Chloroflexota bacterium]